MGGVTSPDELRAELERLQAELAKRDEDLAAQCKVIRDKDRHIEILQGKIQALQRHMFGRSSERFIGHPELPFPGDEPEPETPDFARDVPDDEERNTDHKRKPRRKRGMTRVSDDLPRVRVEIPVSDEQRRCSCGCEMAQIGEEVTEVLEYQPSSFFVREIVRPKLACKHHEEHGVSTPALPPRPIPKGMAGPSLLAQIVTAKYKDHLPLHRQHGIYKRHGVDIAESTMVDWIRGVAELVDPIVSAMRDSILSRDIVSTDDTPICVLDPQRPKGSRKGFLWAYLGDPGETVFDFTVSRGRDGPRNFFGDFMGFIQADAYAGYDTLFRSADRIEVGCWAHARRGFHDALDTDPENAKHAIAAIRTLYDIERQADDAGMDPEVRRELRAQQSAPLLVDFKAWLDVIQPHVLPKSQMGKAIGYAMRQWEALNRFLDDGRLKLDNNRCERAIRQVAIGRKNWLFAGSEQGGRRAATLYSLIGGCIELALDPCAYLTDILQRAAEGGDPGQLTPLAWANARG